MASMVRVCSKDEVAEGELKRLTVGEVDVCLTRAGGKLYAVQDRCGHMSAPLTLGKLEGTSLTCPLHSAVFEVAGGKILAPPQVQAPTPEQLQQNPRAGIAYRVRTYPLRTFTAEEKDEGVYVELP